MQKVNILGIEYTIEECELENGIDGQADKTSKKIFINKKLNEDRKDGEVERKDIYKQSVIRHEIIHAIMYECGIDCNVGKIHNEEVVDWLAMQYPKIKKIFSELGIEE